MKNQTLSFLMRRFKEAGFYPHKKLGQNFLIDGNLQHLILDSAQLGPEDVVLEVGTGTGSLTVLMAPLAGRVITVEIDRHLHQLAFEELFGQDNVRMLLLDALKNKNRLNEELLEVIAAELDAVPGSRFKLVANLPYSVATPILSNLLALDTPPHSMTITIQKELADRLVAGPRTKDYGALSIWVQSQCHVEIVRVMAPSVFWPRPKVYSAVVQITLDPARRERIGDRTFFHSFVRSMFFHRRKFLRSELLSAFKGRLGKPEVDEIMARLGVDSTIRAEELTVSEMLALAEAVRTAVGD
ncbi:MAG: ribosomal RNA small subunit methyltransferase A [Planctomycetes bacterium]|nr:ribosomal RNA small subunit methyltransferase A [Planctomycetota bacterium]